LPPRSSTTAFPRPGRPLPPGSTPPSCSRASRPFWTPPFSP